MPAAPPPVYRCAVVGGGPAGLSLLIKAARIRKLKPLLDRDGEGLALIEETECLGRGNLGKYAISSNTHAAAFVSAVLSDEPELSPPESPRKGPLNRLSKSVAGKALEECGAEIVPLKKVGDWLEDIGDNLESLLKRCPHSRCYKSTRVTQIRRLPDSDPDQFIWYLTLETSTADGDCAPATQTIYAHNVVLACGGRQVVPESLSKLICPAQMVSSNTILQGRYTWSESGLTPDSTAEVLIVGGSHSAFSVAKVVLEQFPSVKVRLIHRSPIKVYFASTQDAHAAGYKEFAGLSSGGHVHEFAGLRGDAKQLFLATKSGSEKRLELLHTSPEKVAEVLQNELRRSVPPSLICWAGGYTHNAPKLLDTTNHPLNVDLSTVESSSAQPRFRVGYTQQTTPAPVVPNLFCLGLGFSFLSKNSDGTTDGSADSFSVYCRRQATIVLAGILGTSVYGGNYTSWKERHRRLQATRKIQQQQQQQQQQQCTASKEKTTAAPVVDAPPEVPKAKAAEGTETIPLPPALERQGFQRPSSPPPPPPPPPLDPPRSDRVVVENETLTSGFESSEGDGSPAGAESPKSVVESFPNTTDSPAQRDDASDPSDGDRTQEDDTSKKTSSDSGSSSSQEDDAESEELDKEGQAEAAPLQVAPPVVKTTEERAKRILLTLKKYSRKRSSLLTSWRQTAPLQLWSNVIWQVECGWVSALSLSGLDLRCEVGHLVDTVLCNLGGIKSVMLDYNNGDLFNRGLHGSIECFKKLPQLETLSLAENFNRIDGSISAFIALPHLQSLNMSGCVHVEGDLASLSELRLLTTLNLRNCSKITGCLANLKKNTKLTLLNLRSCNKIRGDFAEVLQLKKLRRLDLSYCPKLTGDKQQLRNALPFCASTLVGSQYPQQRRGFSISSSRSSSRDSRLV